MLKWALCRALIISPPSIVNRIKGTAAYAEIFVNAIEPMRRLILTRMEVCRQLRQPSEEEEEEEDLEERPAKRSRLEKLEEKVDSLFQKLYHKIESLKSNSVIDQSEAHSSANTGFLSHNDYESDIENEDPLEDGGASDTDEPSVFQVPTFNLGDEPGGSASKDISFTPNVKEDDPLVSTQSETLKIQGVACQKLGSSSWNRIKYKDVQKKLRAAPVFDALKVNDQLGSITQNKFCQNVLMNADMTLGSICHGLLKQREALTEQIRDLTKRHPEVMNEVQELLSSNSSVFKNVSDDILHYTCARRAEIIDLRRRVFKPNNDFLATKLSQIPPSETHLFDEEKFDNFINKQGGFYRIFRSTRKSSQSASNSNYNKGRLEKSKQEQNRKSKQTNWKKPQASTPTAVAQSRNYKDKQRGPKKRQASKNERSSSY